MVNCAEGAYNGGNDLPHVMNSQAFAEVISAEFERRILLYLLLVHCKQAGEPIDVAIDKTIKNIGQRLIDEMAQRSSQSDLAAMLLGDTDKAIQEAMEGVKQNYLAMVQGMESAQTNEAPQAILKVLNKNAELYRRLADS